MTNAEEKVVSTIYDLLLGVQNDLQIYGYKAPLLEDRKLNSITINDVKSISKTIEYIVEFSKTACNAGSAAMKLQSENEALKQELAKLKSKYGKAGRKSKFNNEQKRSIKYLYKFKGYTMDSLAREFKCSKGLIHKIVHGEI